MEYRVIIYQMKRQNSINIESDSQNQKLSLKIQDSRQKLKSSFPNDPRSDLEIITKSSKYKLQKAHLRLYSDYFREVCKTDTKVIQLKQFHEQNILRQILSLFYGFTIEMPRSKINIYYRILKKLEVKSILACIREDVLKNYESYNIFNILRIAQKNCDEQLFQCCHQALNKQQFQQLKYQQYQLFQLDLSLFKLIIKTHNKYKLETGKGLCYIDVDKILKNYCQANSFEEEIYQNLKCEVLDVKNLNSKEYKQIFLDETHCYFDNCEQANSSCLSESTINSANNSGNENNGVMQKKLQMQNTFQKKRNAELKDKNIFLQQQLVNIKAQANKNEDARAQMEEQIIFLKEELKKKNLLDISQKNTISKYEKIFDFMTKQLQKKTTQIDNLSTRFEQILKTRKQEEQEHVQVENNIIVQSQFLPAHFIGQLMGNRQPFEVKVSTSQIVKQKKLKNSQQGAKKSQDKKQKKVSYDHLDDDEIEQLYQDRLIFDEEPKSVPKKQLPKLSIFFSHGGFNTRKFQLVYRRSKNQPNKGEKVDMLNKDSLLILISTQFKQYIGGYLSVPLKSSNIGYYSDDKAFIFNLNKNKKFDIEKSNRQQAIFMSQSYLLSFGNDLMISNDPLNQRSTCLWPDLYYNLKKESGQENSTWFGGGKEFLINDIEIYSICQAEMEMVL